MIQEIRGFPILQGVRGNSGANLNILIDALQRLSQLALDWPQILEMDLNPFIISSETKNCKIADARIRIKI